MNKQRKLLGLLLSVALAPACGVDDPAPLPGTSTGSGPQGSGTGTGPQGANCAPKIHTGDVIASEGAQLGVLEGVTHLQGSLSVSGLALQSLPNLRCLVQVDGDLDLQGAPEVPLAPNALSAMTDLSVVLGGVTLNKLSGVARPELVSLRSVGADFRIINNPQMVDLGGLGALSEVKSQLMVARNPLLNNMQGLSQVRAAGEVLVLENPALTQVGGFSQLTVTGRLKFAQNPLLTSLAGFENITRLEALVVEGNSALTSLAALGRLTQVDREILILNNAVLGNLQGLEALAVSPLRFEIEKNPVLNNLDALTRLPAPAMRESVFKIQNNPALVRLGPWSSWVQGSGELHVVSNPALATLAGLENLSSIGTLVLHGPDAVPNLDQLGKLATVERRLSIGGRDSWTALTGLGALANVGELELVNMAGLSDISRFSTVAGLSSFRLFNLPALRDLSAFSHLTKIEGDLWLEQMDGLPTLAGLDNITSVSNRLVLEKVNQIPNLANLSKVTQAGTVVIAENAKLVDFSGLEQLTQLTQLEGGLCIHRNPALVQMDAISNLTKVEGSVTFTENPVLENFNGVSGLTDIGTSLWIDGSPKVTTLAPFSTLVRIGGRAWGFDDNCPDILAARDYLTNSKWHGFMGIEVRMMNIKDLSGLENLQLIKGGISIKENPELTDLSSLFGKRVEGVTLEVRRNPKMDQCHALSIEKKLGFFDGDDIRIWDNLGVDDPKCD